MVKRSRTFAQRLGSGLLALALLAVSSISPARGCTIFVLTDGRETLFFNNEDWSNPVSRIWFAPAPEGFYSCVYVGFENNGSEGGMNTAGLAFDWVAGFTENWVPYKSMKPVGGRTSERMLETCATVEEAIAFYETYREPQFNRAKILVADQSGASAIIGARDGKLEVDRANHSRGFGYGGQKLATMLSTDTKPQLSTGLEILRACEQKGEFATKYSSVFNLKNREISIFVPGSDEEIKLDLQAEIDRGSHYYDLAKIREQRSGELKPALSNMRSFLREYNAEPDPNRKNTKKVESITRSCVTGKMRASDFAPEIWHHLSPIQSAIQADLKPFGKFKKARFVGSFENGTSRYKLEFKNAWVLQDVAFDQQGRLSSIRSLGTEWKHPLPR